MWVPAALLSAVFAALTAIFAKIGLRGVESNLSNAIRTCVVLVVSWGMVFMKGSQHTIGSISHESWLFLILSGLATGISSLLYYYALQNGDLTKVVPISKLNVILMLIFGFIFLHEKLTMKSLIGCIFIAIGTLLMSF